MRCETAREYLDAWHDGELGPVTAWRVGRHVRRCADCASESETLARFDAALRAAAPFGPEARPATFRRARWMPVLSIGAAALLLGIVFAAREGTPTAPSSGASSPVYVAVAPTPSPAPPTLPPKRVTPAPKSTDRAAVKPPPVPARATRRTRHRWPSPVYRPMPRRALKPRIAPTPETDREVILIAARTLTPEEVLAQCAASESEEVIEIYAEVVPPEMPGMPSESETPAPPPADDPALMPESN